MDIVFFYFMWMVFENFIIEIEKQLIGGDMYKCVVKVLYLCELSLVSIKCYVEEII